MAGILPVANVESLKRFIGDVETFNHGFTSGSSLEEESMFFRRHQMLHVGEEN